jgi:phospholipase A-2-activating protein
VELPNIGFATCSNDETVKIWTMDGTNLQTMSGHTGFVFCVDALNTGELISGGDDCTVKVWNPMDGSLKQTI